MASRPGAGNELVVFGATGYTGREGVAHLASRAKALGLRWTIAGRDGPALTALAGDLTEPRPAIAVADATDPASLADLVAGSVAVISFAGPHAPLGDALLERCVAGGAHYADLCGENDVIAARIARLHVPARAAGVKLVQACGYESAPFDLGVLELDRAFRAADGSRLVEVEAEVSFLFRRSPLRFGHGNSSGTLATVARLVEDRELTDPGRLAQLLDQAPASTPRPAIELDASRSPAGDWLAPLMPTPFLTPAIVELSRALLAEEDPSAPPALAYREALNTSASLGSAALGGLWAKGASAATRRVAAMSQGRRSPGDRALLATLRALAGRSGGGPSRSLLSAIDYRIRMRALSTTGARRQALVHAAGHPGYASAPRILAEAGIALARDRSLPECHGILTPATALGTQFIPALAAAGLHFELGEGTA